jgi:hypothetical protein
MRNKSKLTADGVPVAEAVLDDFLHELSHGRCCSLREIRLDKVTKVEGRRGPECGSSPSVGVLATALANR